MFAPDDIRKEIGFLIDEGIDKFDNAFGANCSKIKKSKDSYEVKAKIDAMK